MAKYFKAVKVVKLLDNGRICQAFENDVNLKVNYDTQGLSLEIETGTLLFFIIKIFKTANRIVSVLINYTLM